MSYHNRKCFNSNLILIAEFKTLTCLNGTLITEEAERCKEQYNTAITKMTYAGPSQRETASKLCK